MKMKKFMAVLLTCCMIAPMAACGGSTPATQGGNNPASDAGQEAGTSSGETGDAGEAGSGEAVETKDTATGSASSSELVDGKFAETRHITVEVYDRGNDGGSDPTDNMYTKYIKEGMLADHNVEVEFKAVPRWTEVDELNNLLAAGDAPDICVTYDYPTIQTYANMGGVQDLQPYVDGCKDDLPNLWNWLEATNIYWDKNISDGTIWAIEGKRATTNRIVTFVRQDWLDKLGIAEPTTTQEFADMLVAFRDNADTLLGSDASKIVPYSVSYDVGWRTATLIESFIDPQISDYDFYVNGFDDRKLTEPGTKDAIKLVNKWYNDNLMWKDFALYESDSTVEDDMMKAGYVGAFTHNWDYPFRNGDDSINANLSRLIGPEAKFVAIDPFQDKNGGHNKFVTSTAGDRKIFFPNSNDEPLASMLYLDWISDPEHIQYLQLGDEGVTHNKLDDGSYEVIAAEGEAIMNSGMNIDYTITCNGLHLMDDETTLKSTAHNYPGIEPADVEKADKIANTDIRREKNINVGQVTSEDGMGTALSEKRDAVYDQSVIVAPEKFDETWDYYMEDYLTSGGQAIIDERAQLWSDTYGSATNLEQ